MGDVVEKVTKLIALTASPIEGEARNAALKACELIREHGLVVTDGAGVAEMSWLNGLTAAERGMHVSFDGTNTICRDSLGNGVSYLMIHFASMLSERDSLCGTIKGAWPHLPVDKLPALHRCCLACLKNCCRDCLFAVVRAKKAAAK